MKNSMSDKQTRYLSQAIQLEEAVNPHIVRATMSMISLFILAFLVWAAFTNVNEIARTPGEIVPQGHQQIVQHLEGGMVKSILVNEGDTVEEGQILLTLSDATINEDLQRAQSKQLSLSLQAERLRAFIENREPDFSMFKQIDQNALNDQDQFFDGMRSARAGEASIIRDQIAEKKQSLQSLSSEIQTARNDLYLAREMYDKRQKLHQKGYASSMQLMEDETRVNDIVGNITRLENDKLLIGKQIGEYNARAQSLSAGHRDAALERLAAIEAEKNENTQIVDKIRERVSRLSITSPTHGMIKGLSVNTIGAVIQPGQIILEILPLDKALEVAVKINPQDIGHLNLGQDVRVKFSTFDFSRYGFVEGKLDYISATTFKGDSRGNDGAGNGRHYQGRVILKQDYVGKNPKNRVQPGMTVMADVITGRKTILQYMLRPIHNSLQTAFTER